jgi:rifampin ADP-ribosylating transferase
LGNAERAEEHRRLAASTDDTPIDQGPFFHGTKAELQLGELLMPGGLSNYKADLKMNHIYFTARASGAGLAAELAKGDGRGLVYVVQPTGLFEHDPNVTNQKFPGNPTRSYRSAMPLKIVGELDDWSRLAPEELQRWRERVAESRGEIIN